VKWFSREWQSGGLTDEAVRGIEADYVAHVERIRPLLPPGLQILLEAGGWASLHDGRFVQVQHKVGRPDLLLVDIAAWTSRGRTKVGNAWDEPRMHVRLAYEGAEVISPGASELDGIIRNPKTEILAGEVDVDENGVFEHRMLLWPRESPEFVVRFQSVEVAVVRFIDGRADILYPPGS
jgi:hypothetical protein